MVYYGLLWFIMVYYGLLWFIMVYYGLLWFIMVYYGLLWFIMVYVSNKHNIAYNQLHTLNIVLNNRVVN